MTQQVVRARVSFPNNNTLEDQSSFDLIFESTGSDVNIDFSTFNSPTDVITHFLNALAPGQTDALCGYLSPDISRGSNAVAINYTDITAHLDGSPAGGPFRTDHLTLGPAIGGALPAQVALVVGYRGDYGTAIEHGPSTSLPSDESAIDQGAPATHLGNTRPRARLRGRFYFGPLSVHANGGNAANPVSGFLTDMTAALHDLFATWNPGLADQLNVVQWSRRNASVATVNDFYVNEGFGTLRKRQDTTLNRVHSWVAR